MPQLLSGRLPSVKIGIPSYSEDLATLSVVGISSLDKISVGGSTGADGQYLVSTGIGLTWKTLSNEDLSVVRTSYDYAATAGQTTFNLEYTVGYIDVFVNGVLLATSEYTATNGTSVVLSEALFVNDTVQIVAYNPYTVISTAGAISAGGTTGNFVGINLFNRQPLGLTPAPAAQLRIEDTWEVGYKGLVNNKLALSLDIYNRKIDRLAFYT